MLVAQVSGSGSTYTVSVTGMTGNGTVVASIAAGAAQDAAGNASTASTSTDNTVAFDAVAPTVTINQAAGQHDPTDSSPIFSPLSSANLSRVLMPATLTYPLVPRVEISLPK